MFDELKKLNIETRSDSELVALLRQTASIATLHIQATQELINRHDNNSNQTTSSEGGNNSQYFFIANGTKLAIQQLSDINEDDFDVILDTTTNSLRYRKDPVRHSKLKKSKLEKVGSFRMKILAHMLEHPDKPFHCENVYKAYKPTPETQEVNTFTKTIGTLRAALDQKDTSGPYIEKKFDWDGITDSKRGCVYKINPEWRYLVIRHRKNSG